MVECPECNSKIEYIQIVCENCGIEIGWESERLGWGLRVKKREHLDIFPGGHVFEKPKDKVENPLGTPVKFSIRRHH